MKKRILTAIAFLLIVKNKLLAQQWAMDEAYDDWRDTRSNDTSFGHGLLGLIILAAAIFVLWQIVHLVKENKEGIKDFFEENEGCGCLLLIFGIVGFLTLIGVIK
ncbi:MAG: hypothetical protein SPL12_06700 [Bacteroidales bacterium]|nr:hypothetical protein [Bacteroidales bacterium]